MPSPSASATITQSVSPLPWLIRVSNRWQLRSPAKEIGTTIGPIGDDTPPKRPTSLNIRSSATNCSASASYPYTIPDLSSHIENNGRVVLACTITAPEGEYRTSRSVLPEFPSE